MSKKRKVPAAVTAALARKRKQTVSMAQRQAGALGKVAREQLQSLIEADANVVDEIGRPLTAAGVAMQQAMEDQQRQYYQSLQQSIWATPPATSIWLTPSNFLLPSGTWWGSALGEASPIITTDLLESLKAATPYKPAPQLRVPDMVECIVGWRAWMLSKTGLLESLGQNSVWPAKQMISAVCEASGRHPAPNWGCTCGIWAFKDVDKLVAAIGGSYAGTKVIGPVSLWGKVIETENGWRAEFAYPKELWLLDGSLEELGLIYDVPIRVAQRQPSKKVGQ